MEPKTVYLSSALVGLVLALKDNRPSTVVTTENITDRDEVQKWNIEYGDEPGTFALQSVANGEYLRCFEARSNGKVGTGDKQWWKTSVRKYTPAGAFQLSPLLTAPKQCYLQERGASIQKRDAGLATLMSTENVSLWSGQDWNHSTTNSKVAAKYYPLLVHRRHLNVPRPIGFDFFWWHCLKGRI
jgi:hypothetical protein